MHPFQKSKPESLLDPPLILLWRVLKAWDKLDLFFSLMIINKIELFQAHEMFFEIPTIPTTKHCNWTHPHSVIIKNLGKSKRFQYILSLFLFLSFTLVVQLNFSKLY